MFGILLGHLSHLKKRKVITTLGMKYKEVTKYVNKEIYQKMFAIYFILHLYNIKMWGKVK